MQVKRLIVPTKDWIVCNFGRLYDIIESSDDSLSSEQFYVRLHEVRSLWKVDSGFSDPATFTQSFASLYDLESHP